MKLLCSASDGGANSGVKAYFLFEIKRIGSVALLRFDEGTREAFHSHAFNALTWWLRGSVTERHVDGSVRSWGPSIKPKLTKRSCFHRVESNGVTWALTFRGPWCDSWLELRHGKTVTLTHGRVEIQQ